MNVGNVSFMLQRKNKNARALKQIAAPPLAHIPPTPGPGLSSVPTALAPPSALPAPRSSLPGATARKSQSRQDGEYGIVIVPAGHCLPGGCWHNGKQHPSVV